MVIIKMVLNLILTIPWWVIDILLIASVVGLIKENIHLRNKVVDLEDSEEGR